MCIRDRVRRGGKGLIPNKKSRDYQERVSVACRIGAKLNRVWYDDVEVSIYMSKQRVDIDGIKAILDGLEDSYVIKNDGQVATLHVSRVDDKEQGMSIIVKDVPRR